MAPGFQWRRALAFDHWSLRRFVLISAQGARPGSKARSDVDGALEKE
jgi:hypothetical protein